MQKVRTGFRSPSFSSPRRSSSAGRRRLHEIKYDGYRTQVIVEGGRARAFTRRGFDWSDKYPHLVEAAAALPVEGGDHRRRGHRHEQGRPVGFRGAAFLYPLAAGRHHFGRVRPAAHTNERRPRMAKRRHSPMRLDARYEMLNSPSGGEPKHPFLADSWRGLITAET